MDTLNIAPESTKTEVHLEAGKLYLLSGMPGAGKSTWLSGIAPSMVVSPDAMREILAGSYHWDGRRHRYEEVSPKAFDLVRQIVQFRLSERLTTFVDATLINDAERADFVKMAKDAGVGVEVLIFDRPAQVCVARDSGRQTTVGEKVISLFATKFQNDSKYPFRNIADNTVPVLVARKLPHAEIDVIGDVHGLMDDLIELLVNLGYSLASGVPVHPQERKLLFLGDVVDRGPQSIEVLQLMRKAVEAGHFMVMGNHEHKLIKFWDSLKKGEPQARSFSSAETAMSLMRMPEKDRGPLVEFVRTLPAYYVYEHGEHKYAFVHANLVRFNPLTTLHSECLYGSSRAKAIEDTDAVYAEGFDRGENQYKLIRGHVMATSLPDSCFSLEFDQAFAGDLAALRLDIFMASQADQSARDAFSCCVIKKRCNFDFKAHSEKFVLKRELDKLVKERLAVVQVQPESGLALYKYSKRVFFDALWNESDYLLKARGIALDQAGAIVVHPFDKVFNYGENGAGLSLRDEQEVIAVEKLNGFLGCISRHPFKHDVLATTTGSFDSPFVGYIRDFITPQAKGKLLKFMAYNNMTLMFEVIHGSDPHIIEYDDAYQGLWLIGARGKDPKAALETEDSLDNIADEIGVRRPAWYKTTFGELKGKVQVSKLEGFMVRDIASQETILKFKTPYYLVTKFLGRLSNDKIKFMYAKPKVFKERIDEEFYPLVDHLTTNVSLDVFFAMTDNERVILVRDAINQLQS